MGDRHLAAFGGGGCRVLAESNRSQIIRHHVDPCVLQIAEDDHRHLVIRKQRDMRDEAGIAAVLFDVFVLGYLVSRASQP